LVLMALAVQARAQFPQNPPTLVIERFIADTRPVGGWTASSGVNAEYVSWTIPPGVQYTGVIVNAHLSGVGGTGTGTAYLYSAPGTSGTLTSGTSLVAFTGVSVTGNVPDFAPTNLFQNLTFPSSSGPVTYYLLLVPSNAYLAWDTSNSTTTYTAIGATLNPDQGATGAVASPPSASTWSALSPNGMLFEVFATMPPPTIGTTAAAPSLSPPALFLAALLLGSLGCLLLRRRAGMLLAFLLLCQAGFGQTAAQPAFAASRALVKFRSAVGSAASLPADVVAAYDLSVARPAGGAGAYLLQSRSQSTAALISALQARADVVAVSPDYVIGPASTPNDPLYQYQWGLPKIGAESAWNSSTGSTGSVVAVLDTGVDYTHPDLNANMWSAPNNFTVTIAGQQRTCPQGSHGFTSITDNNGNATMNFDPQEAPGSVAYGHGTAVSGVVGAVGNNSTGVAGVNWTARIMGLRMAGNPNAPGCTAGFCGYLSDALNVIDFAIQAKQQLGAQANVRILSASWGWNVNLYGCTFEDCQHAQQILSDEIDRANANDMLFVAAAGNGTDGNWVPIDNDTNQYPMYPATLGNANIISVAASNSSDALANYSNYGALTVHLSAPSGDFIGGSCINGTFSTTPNSGYGYWCGTSLATPFVSGAAALVLAACANSGISPTTDGLKGAILSSVDINPAGCQPSDPLCLYGHTATGGRLNVYNAIYNACQTAGNLTVSQSISQQYGNPVYWARGNITMGAGNNQQIATSGAAGLVFQATQITLLPNLAIIPSGTGSIKLSAAPQVH
jgi:subtilisin family serine protease